MALPKPGLIIKDFVNSTSYFIISLEVYEKVKCVNNSVYTFSNPTLILSKSFELDLVLTDIFNIEGLA